MPENNYYYIKDEHLEDIKDWGNEIIIGRSGNGKTVLAEYYMDLMKQDGLIIEVINFNKVIENRNINKNNWDRMNVELWRNYIEWIMLIEISDVLVRNCKIPSDKIASLKRIIQHQNKNNKYVLKSLNGFAEVVKGSKVSASAGIGANISILQTGLNLTVEVPLNSLAVSMENQANEHKKDFMSDEIETLKKDIYEIITYSKRKLIIIVDDTDLVYNLIGRQEQFQIIKELLLATRRINDYFKNSEIKVMPIVRDYLYRTICNDRNFNGANFNNSRVDLDWEHLTKQHFYKNLFLKDDLIKIALNNVRRHISEYKFHTDEEICDEIFGELISHQNALLTILQWTTGKPRDIDAFMSLALPRIEVHGKFNGSILNGIKKKYSRKLYGFIIEEMKIYENYNELIELISLLEIIQSSSGVHFSFNQIAKESNQSKHQLIRNLNIFYDLGIIGNAEKSTIARRPPLIMYSWVKDPSFNYEDEMYINYGLRKKNLI